MLEFELGRGYDKARLFIQQEAQQLLGVSDRTAPQT